MKRRVVIEVPAPMPTWNRLLQMHPWQRMKCRHLVHAFVENAVGNKPISTELQRLEYFHLIRPNKRRKSQLKGLRSGNKKMHKM